MAKMKQLVVSIFTDLLADLLNNIVKVKHSTKTIKSYYSTELWDHNYEQESFSSMEIVDC